MSRAPLSNAFVPVVILTYYLPPSGFILIATL